MKQFFFLVPFLIVLILISMALQISQILRHDYDQCGRLWYILSGHKKI